MGPALGVDPLARLLLDPVVADGLGRVDGLVDVALVEVGEDAVAVTRVPGPHAGVAVGLELEAHGVGLGALLGADLAHGAEQVLDVVAVLVAEDVGLDEVAALAAELALEDVGEEGRVEVDLLIGRAVEGSDLRGGLAAAGVDAAAEGDDLRRGELGAALLGKGLGPVLLEGEGHGLAGAVDVVVGVGAGLAVGVAVAVLVQARGVAALAGRVHTRGGATAAAHALGEHEEQDDHQDAADAAAGLGAAGHRDAHRAAATATSAAAGVADATPADVSLRVEPHVECLSTEQGEDRGAG